MNVVLEPTKQTIKVLWQGIPGKEFYEQVLETLQEGVYTFKDYLLGWAYNALEFIYTSLRNALTEIIAETSKSVFSKLKFW